MTFFLFLLCERCLIGDERVEGEKELLRSSMEKVLSVIHEAISRERLKRPLIKNFSDFSTE